MRVLKEVQPHDQRRLSGEDLERSLDGGTLCFFSYIFLQVFKDLTVKATRFANTSLNRTQIIPEQSFPQVMHIQKYCILYKYYKYYV